jgi:uracil-DNA glycosylase
MKRPPMNQLKVLLSEVRSCTHCSMHLPHGTRPVLQFHPNARILIAGQAPGRKVHESGIPFNDASGDRLRVWMGITKEVFYDATQIAILPMGFCYPGTGPSGDLPPRTECAPLWREKLLSGLVHLKLTLVIGEYAQAYHFPNRSGDSHSVTSRVEAWRDHFPILFPLPHPSPRNNIWLRRNSWFEQDAVPALRQRTAEVLRNE